MVDYRTSLATIVQVISWNGFMPRGFAPPLSRKCLVPNVAAKPASSIDETDSAVYVSTFKGRAMLRPCFQRVVASSASTSSFNTLSLFGWTIGGRVALQYDESPAADGLAYNEFVTLGYLGICKHGIGQVGTALYVNETRAVELCDSVWDLGAKFARIELREEGSTLSIQENQSNRIFQVNGWSTLRTDDPSDRNVRLNLLWTPTITGIWARLLPWLPFPKTGDLPLHRLRVSGNAKIQFSGELESEHQDGLIPLGVDILLQNALIEISPRIN